MKGKRPARGERQENEHLPLTIPYFAYGSNLNLSQMAYRCPGAIAVQGCSLQGYRLDFRGVLDITPAKNNEVPGGLWFLQIANLKALDHYEGYPALYTRKTLRILLPNGQKIEAMTYQMTAPARELSTPSEGYFRTCAEGYRDFGLSTEALIKARGRAREAEEKAVPPSYQDWFANLGRALFTEEEPEPGLDFAYPLEPPATELTQEVLPMKNLPQIGDRVRAYTGGIFTITHLVRDVETGEVLVKAIDDVGGPVVLRDGEFEIVAS